MAIRVNFVIAAMIIGFGILLNIYDRLKSNYIFVLQIPQSIIGGGPNEVIKVGCI